MVESVDLAVPFTARIVPLSDRRAVVYELHVTNFLRTPVELRRAEFRAPALAGLLATYAGEALAARIGRPGLSRSHPEPHVIAPGMRAVLHVWIDLPRHGPVPNVLEHLVEVDVGAPGENRRTIVERYALAIDPAPPMVLDPPLRGGPWIAIYDPLLKGGHRTAIYTVHGRARIPGRFAIDFVKPDAAGRLQAKPPAAPEGWNGYGSPVLAVADGIIEAIRDGFPESDPVAAGPQPPLSLDDASGNHVVLRIALGRYAFYEHLAPGSITVRVGERVRRGQVLGAVGRSGSTSIGPHLHFHVADTPHPLGAEGLPFVLGRFTHLGAFTSLQEMVDGGPWSPLPDGGSSGRSKERPDPLAVVRFGER